jgi:hypothetical protein
MGMGNIDVDLIRSLREKGYIRDHASVVEIGAQQLSAHMLMMPDATVAIGRKFGVEHRGFGEATLSYAKHSSVEVLDPNAPASREFWQWLGMTYAAIDIDGSPGSIPLDLNYDSTPPEMIGKFDIVTNYGTTEHIANQLNAFKVIHELCCQGGVIVHNLPAQGMMQHGLFNYNPKFFWMLARSCGYKMLDADMSMGPTLRVPEGIVNEISLFRPDIANRAENYTVRDSGIIFAFQKSLDIPFVAPIDVPTGAAVDNEALRERYWTVFDDERMQKVAGKSSARTFVSKALRRIARALEA